MKDFMMMPKGFAGLPMEEEREYEMEA